MKKVSPGRGGEGGEVGVCSLISFLRSTFLESRGGGEDWTSHSVGKEKISEGKGEGQLRPDIRGQIPHSWKNFGGGENANIGEEKEKGDCSEKISWPNPPYKKKTPKIKLLLNRP